MLKRGGIYGYGTFAQARQADHPVAYDQRKRNKLMVEYSTPGVPQEFPLRPVSIKGRPVTLNFDYDTTQVVKSQRIIKTANATLKTSYNNEFIYFNSGTLDNYFEIPQALKSEITPFEQLVNLKNNNGITLNWVHYKECVFPSLRNEFASATSFRYGYDNKFWRDDPKERIKQIAITAIPEKVVPNLVGLKQEEAELLLDQDDLKSLVVGARKHPNYDTGIII